MAPPALLTQLPAMLQDISYLLRLLANYPMPKITITAHCTDQAAFERARPGARAACGGGRARALCPSNAGCPSLPGESDLELRGSMWAMASFVDWAAAGRCVGSTLPAASQPLPTPAALPTRPLQPWTLSTPRKA